MQKAVIKVLENSFVHNFDTVKLQIYKSNIGHFNFRVILTPSDYKYINKILDT